MSRETTPLQLNNLEFWVEETHAGIGIQAHDTSKLPEEDGRLIFTDTVGLNEIGEQSVHDWIMRWHNLLSAMGLGSITSDQIKARIRRKSAATLQ